MTTSVSRQPRTDTHQVFVGTVPLGGGAPVVVQSMLNKPARDVTANVDQINALAAAGCEVVRIAIPHKEALPAFEAVCAESSLPVVADIHFSAELAIEAARRGAAKLRINPGNIGGLEPTARVLEAAAVASIPVRIGVNAGSLERRLADNADLTLPEKLAASAIEYATFCEREGFHELVISAKAHDVPTTIAAYRRIAHELPDVPLHIGITEAGTIFQGLIKSAAGLGVLLEKGIGDTLRISLTDDPVEEVRAAWTLLAALGLRRRGPEIVSCPTCGRTQVDLIALAQEVEARLAGRSEPVTVAVMGCVVNGPGEAADADLGVACGDGVGLVFSHGTIRRKVAEEAIVDALIEELDRL